MLTIRGSSSPVSRLLGRTTAVIVGMEMVEPSDVRTRILACARVTAFSGAVLVEGVVPSGMVLYNLLSGKECLDGAFHSVV